MSDDAEFDAFLKGEDALSRRLQALPAAAPGAALDAAILQRARELMAQESRPQAANDAGDGGANPLPPRLGRLGWRWRIPAGIAATVLAGVFANQAYQASNDMQRGAGMPAEEAKVLIVQPEAEARAPASPAAPAAPLKEEVPAARPAPAPATATAPAPVPAPSVAVAVQEPRPRAREEMRDAAAAPPQVPAQAMGNVQAPSARAPVAAPAPVAAAASEKSAFAHKRSQAAAEAALQRVEVTGSRVTRQDMESASPVTVINAKPVASAQQEWLANIAALLDEGKDTEALDQWRRFRSAHPYYHVPQALEDRIKAIE